MYPNYPPATVSGHALCGPKQSQGDDSGHALGQDAEDAEREQDAERFRREQDAESFRRDVGTDSGRFDGMAGAPFVSSGLGTCDGLVMDSAGRNVSCVSCGVLGFGAGLFPGSVWRPTFSSQYGKRINSMFCPFSALSSAYSFVQVRLSLKSRLLDGWRCISCCPWSPRGEFVLKGCAHVHARAFFFMDIVCTRERLTKSTQIAM